MQCPQKLSTGRFQALLPVIYASVLYAWAGYLLGGLIAAGTGRPLPAPPNFSKFETVEEIHEAGEEYLQAGDARRDREEIYRLTGLTAGCLASVIFSAIREMRRRRNAPRLEAEARLREAESDADFQIRAAAARRRTAALWRKDHPDAKTPDPLS